MEENIFNDVRDRDLDHIRSIKRSDILINDVLNG